MHQQPIKTLLILLLAALVLWAAPGVAEDEFLAPDEAFAISATHTKDGKLRVHWRVADGYYLYRSKFRFESDTPGVELGRSEMPDSLTKQDPIFGEVQIYRDSVAIPVQIANRPHGAQMLTLKARSQGCADAGICYPPHTQTVLVALVDQADGPLAVDPRSVAEMQEVIANRIGSPAGGSALDDIETIDRIEPGALSAVTAGAVLADAAASDPLAELGALGEELGLPDDDILPPEQAFQVSADVIDGETVRLSWQVAPGTYLYEDKVEIRVDGRDLSAGEFQLPKAKIKRDSVKPDGSFGDVAVYEQSFEVQVPIRRGGTEPADLSIDVKYQGCAERGICYPPQSKQFSLSLPAVSAATVAAATESAVRQTAKAVPAATAAASADAQPVAEQDQIADMLRGGNTWVIIGSFFIIGLLLAFTPCVFPMIPILSGIIAGQGSKITTRKAFMLSLVYVLAMAVTYTVAGVLAGMFGSNLQAAFQNPWILGVFAAVFVALAMSMFGFYELQLPSTWQSKLSEISNQQEGGTLTGAAIMGLLSALIVGPCVAPPLAGALIYIGQSGDAVLGGLALFAMSLGMGAPLIAIGTSAGKLLPRAGAWMDAVKAVFGVLMLGVAIYLLERVIPESLAMLLWGGLLIMSGVYLGATQQLAVEASGWAKLWKGLGLVLLVYGILFLVGAAAGGRDTLQPLRGVAVGGGAAAEKHLSFKRIKTIADLQAEVRSASAAGKPVMLDFYADWCVYCKEMEKNTFPDADVQAALAKFVLLQADVTANDDADKALQAHVGIPAPPAMLFWNAAGEEQRNYRLLGYKGPTEFAEHVRKAVP